MKKYNLIDFLNDIAFELDRASGFTFSEGEAQDHAADIYQQFLHDETHFKDDEYSLIFMPKFGDKNYDWTADGAHILAHEYSISYWDLQ